MEDDRAKGLKKADLVAFVAESAAERQWAPAALAWDRTTTDDTAGASTSEGDEPAAEPIAGAEPATASEQIAA